ncbi:hypothetical protein Rhopal_007523-T1 [Rhodotorula paludigena]|uniref:C3HC-type domain-containing protein n=1 Tax=Rhodotorula paludigena TaxID=86838 RepID=A0AAV5GW32_9BASI|nr:hypothetical protein Rhopal_007523-T1 [Rhodotorula paludigena]
MANPIDNPAPQQEDAPARVTKRKITDALSSLDAAFKDPVAKAKRRKATTAPTSTPALEAILARTKARASTPSSKLAPPSYEPTSLPALLSRLATYRLSTFSPSKPASLSSLSCALHGWVHTQSTRERVQCVTCGQGIVLLPPSSGDGGWTSGAGKKLREEYERLVQTQGHAETCPWRLRPCARSLYRLAGGGLGVSTGGRRRLLEEVAKQAREMDDQGLAGIALHLPSEVEASLANEGMAQRLETALAAAVSDPQPAADSSTPPASSSVPSSTSKRFDPLKQHQPFCPYVDGYAGHSPALLPAPARANAASNAPLLRPGWQAEDLTSAGKTKEILLYVRNLLGPKGTSRASVVGGSRGPLPTSA